MNPFHDREDELALLTPTSGGTMLELGNKKNGSLTYKDYFESIGFKHTSVDLNGEDGALKLDLRDDLGLGTFDMVTNIGTSEHVTRQCPVWGNMLNAMHVGSVLVSITPAPDHWKGHGLWYPRDVFYEQLAAENDLKIERLYFNQRERGRGLWYFRAVRVKRSSFVFPLGLIERQP